MIQNISLFLVLLISCSTITSGWKIINGTRAIMHEYPQMVSIKVQGSHSCGGTLLNGNTVLTAAHCVWSMRNWNLNTFKSYSMKIYLGEYDLYQMYGVEKIFQVTKVIIHPSYTSDFAYVYGNDVALIKFDGYVSNTQYNYIKYGELDLNSITKPGDRCEVVGWGSMLPPGQDTSRFLQKAAINILSTSECSRIFTNVWYVASNVCAGSGSLSTSACRGDSGGPLFCTDGRRHHIQVGIVSYGQVPCGQANVPTVFTRVSEVARWINQNANLN